MTYEEAVELVDAGINEIAVNSEGLSQSRERAGQFLIIQATLNNYLVEVNEELSKAAALRDAIYADAIKAAEGKNITEKKVNVGKDQAYEEAAKNYDRMESKRDWVKNSMKIFENAHILYRGFSRME